MSGRLLINELESKMMKTAATLLIAAALGFSAAGCNTIHGAGQDIARGGEKVQDASLKMRADWRNWRENHDRDYDSVRNRCASGSESQREACRENARAEYRARMAEARMKYHRAEMRSQSERERMEDAYEAAREQCSALRGAAEDTCIADARARYKL